MTKYRKYFQVGGGGAKIPINKEARELLRASDKVCYQQTFEC